MKSAEEALQEGDFTAYGEAQDDLRDAVDRAIEAQRQIARATDAVEPLPETTPSPEASPEAPLDAGTPAPDAVPSPEVSLSIEAPAA